MKAAVGASEHVRWYQSIRLLIDNLVSDLVSTLQARLRDEGIEVHPLPLPAALKEPLQ